MRTRGMVAIVAVLLAMAATAAVFMYLKGVREEARTGSGMVSVVVSKQDIPVGTDLSRMSTDDFETVSVPRDALVSGAVTNVSQLKGRTTSAPILAGEQITSARLEGSAQIGGGVLGIPEGKQAVTVALNTPQAGGGVIKRGDHVAVYATFADVDVLSGSVRDALSGRTTAGRASIGDFTVTLVPDVQVLKVVGSTVTTAPSADSMIQLTLALTPADAQALVFSQELGKVWTALLPPGEKGRAVPALSVGNLLLGREAQPE